MHKQAGWRDRAHYWLDNTFSRGAGALILWLGVLSVLIVLAEDDDLIERPAARAYAVTLNPPKSQAIVFQPGDRIVVLAED